MNLPIPTKTQINALSMIQTAPNPKAAYVLISSDINTIAARDILLKQGAIEVVSNEASLTDVGEQLLNDYGDVVSDGDIDSPSTEDSDDDYEFDAPDEDQQKTPSYDEEPKQPSGKSLFGEGFDRFSEYRKTLRG